MKTFFNFFSRSENLSEYEDDSMYDTIETVIESDFVTCNEFAAESAEVLPENVNENDASNELSIQRRSSRDNISRDGLRLDFYSSIYHWIYIDLPLPGTDRGDPHLGVRESPWEAKVGT